LFGKKLGECGQKIEKELESIKTANEEEKTQILTQSK
jgi:hypothetical protein